MPATTASHAAPADTAGFTIGEVAARAGVSVQALRYYERRGLVQPAARSRAGYRAYPPDAVRLVRFVKRAQALGFTLSEVGELIRLRGTVWRGEAARGAREAAVAKIRDVDVRVRQLGALREALADLVAACDATCGTDERPTPRPGSVPNAVASGAPGLATAAPRCPILGALDDDPVDTPVSLTW